MLVITRRPGQKVMVGDDIVVQILEITGSSVRIGIQAPRAIPVYREEIWKAMRDEKRAAAETPASVHPPTGTVG